MTDEEVIRAKEEFNEISTKIAITITLSIFLVVVIKNFFNLFQPNIADIASFKFSLISATYTVILFFCYILKNRIMQSNEFRLWINRLLTLNFLLLGLIIIYLPFTNDLTIANEFINIILSGLFSLILAGLILAPILLVIIFVIFSFYSSKDVTEQIKREDDTNYYQGYMTFFAVLVAILNVSFLLLKNVIKADTNISTLTTFFGIVLLLLLSGIGICYYKTLGQKSGSKLIAAIAGLGVGAIALFMYFFFVFK